MIIYPAFYRRFVFRRLSQLGKFIDKSELFEFPKESVLHLLDDNFSFNKPITFVPSKNNWALWLMPPYKFIAHIKEPPAPKLFQYSEQFRLPAQGLNQAINNYRKANLKFVKPLKDLQDLPSRQGVISVINYNSLFRARIIGMRRAVRRFEYIWKSVLNLLVTLPSTHKHYIPIPIGMGQYDRGEFLMSFKKYTRASVKHPEDSWYLFMMHFLGYLHSGTTESVFEKIPVKLRSQVHIILYGRTKMFMFNLEDIKRMNGKSDAILIRTIKALNLLSEDSVEHVIPTTVVDQIDQTQFEGGSRDDIEETYEDDDKDFGEPSTITTTVTPVRQVRTQSEPTEDNIINSVDPTIDFPVPVLPELIRPVMISNDLADLKAVPQPRVVEVTKEIKIPEFYTPELIVDTQQGMAEKPFRKAKPVKQAEKIEKTPEPDLIKPAKKEPTQPQFKRVATINEVLLPDIIEVEEIDHELISVDKDKPNSHNRVRKIEDKEFKAFNDVYIEEIDTAAKNVIEENKDRLTTAQKNRAIKMSEQYKTIKLDGVPLMDILKEIPDDTIATNKLDFLEDKVPDKSMLKSSVQTFDQDYINKLMNKDLVTNLVSFNKQGMFLKEIHKEDVSDDLNSMTTYKVKYEDVHHKEHTIKFTLPKVDENGYCMINGTAKVLKKQRVVVPICKISNTRVTLNSDYNKFLVERNTTVAHSLLDYVDKILAKADPKHIIAIINGKEFRTDVLPYDYTTIASKYIKIIVKKDDLVTFYFNYHDRYDWLKKEMHLQKPDIDAIMAMEDEMKGTFFGITKKHTAMFMLLTGEVKIYNYRDETVVDKDVCFTDILTSLLDIAVPRLSEWVDFKLLNKALPLVFALCYRYGLNYMLNYTKTKFTVSPKGSRMVQRISDIVINFADARLTIPRYPLVNSLIFAGLNHYNLSKVELEAMNTKDVYFELIQSKGMSQHNLKGIDDYFDLFIDPITRDVLFRMGEPTNAKDLLIRAAKLLSTEDHLPPSSESNYRYRTYERFNSAVYKSVARAYATYKNKSIGAAHKMSISDYEVKQLVIQDQLMENADLLNPINDIKYKAAYSHSGFGGRESVDTFMLDDRQFPEDGIGTISEATVDNSNVGYVGSLSSDPVFDNMRGMPAPVTIQDIAPPQLLSTTSILMPCVTNDDGKRANFTNIHLSQYMPTKKSEPSRIRTGYEEVVAHRTIPPFAYPAEDDGMVEKVDDTTQMAVVFYPKLNKRSAIKFGEEYTKNGGGGFYCTQNITLNNFSAGDKFKKGDILAYNNRYFTPDVYSKQVAWNIGTLTDTVIIDSNDTYEDGCSISTKLADELEINPVFVRDIVLKKNTTIHKFVDIGNSITSVDPLIVFDQSEMSDDMFGKLDDEAIQLLAKLNKKSARSGHTGKVVKIDMFYKHNIKDVSQTIQALMNLINKRKGAIRKSASGAANETSFSAKTNIQHSDRIGLTDLDDETVIVRFYIQNTAVMTGGDKLEFDSSLKSVCTSVEEPWEVEDGSVTCHAWFSAIGMDHRIILSPKITGIGNKCLEKLEQDVIDMYFK